MNNDLNKRGRVYFVGAGPGATDLITVRGRDLLAAADVIVYAGSLVNPQLLDYAKQDCIVHNSALMTLEEVAGVLREATERGLMTVRLHTGDPAIYGAIREQMDILRQHDIDFEVVPGVSSFSAAAAALSAEYTLPGVSQSLIITRAAGRTPVPEGESLRSFASHRTSMALFLSSGLISQACEELTAGGYDPGTPAAIVYKASWPQQKIVRGSLADIAQRAEDENIKKTALILIGDFLGDVYDRSKLYDPAFSHEFRAAVARETTVPAPVLNRDETPFEHVYAAFTADGLKTALAIREKLGGVVYAPERFAQAESEGLKKMPGSLGEWTRDVFSRAKSLVFVCATGIAVRAIASSVHDKTSDPAVVCLDDLGGNVIPLLSGHIGGANELAARIAAITGGHAVITTSTDVHGIVAADSWAVERGFEIENSGAVREVSAAMLDGASVGVAVTEETITPPWPVTLWLRPQNLVLGVGCKRGVAESALTEAIADFLADAGVSPLSIAAVASIDLKRDEAAILAWCRERDVPYEVYSASELNSLEGAYSQSKRVLEVTGTDNVCERAAVLAAGRRSSTGRAALMRSKTVYEGITLALAKIRGESDERNGR